MASDWMLNELKNSGVRVPESSYQSTPLSGGKKYFQGSAYQPPKEESLGEKAWHSATAGLGMVGDLLNKPSEITENLITGGQGYEKAGWGLLSTPARFVLDPLNLLGVGVVQKGIKGIGLGTKLAAGLSKVPKVAETINKVKNVAKSTPAIYKAVESFNPAFRVPEVGKMAQAAKETANIRLSKLARQVSEAAKGLEPAKQARIGQLLEGGVSISQSEERLRKIADEFIKLGESVGKEMVDSGLLKPGQFEKYKGQYMHHMWQNAAQGKSFLEGLSEAPKISGITQKTRKGAEGYMREFAAPTFAGLGSSMKDIEAAKFYKQVAGKYGVKAEPQLTSKGLVNSLVNKLSNKKVLKEEKFTRTIPEGYVYAPDELTRARGGEIFKDVALPQEIVDYLTKEVRRNPQSEVGKLFDAGMNFWKKGKTVWNPAYHPRNLVSNQILSEAQTGAGIPKTLVGYGKAVKDYRAGTGLAKEAEDIGLIRRKNFGETVKELAGEVQKKNPLQKLDAKTSELQGAMEDTAKLNVYSYFRKQGKTAEEAKKLAEEAIFSPYRISEAERRSIGRFIPFYSFSRQAAPFIGKKLVTHPERFTKYVKAEKALERTSQGENEQYLPDYMKEMVRTPLKNEKGERKYLSTQYFYPWGNFFEEQKSSVPGLPLGLSMNPFLEELMAQRTGIDPYFGSSFVDKTMSPGEELAARATHAARTFLPTLYRTAEGKVRPALEGRPDYQGRQRNLGDIALGEGAGIKTYPFDVQSGTKAKSWQRYDLQDQYKSRVNRIVKDQSLRPEEKRKQIQQLQKRLKGELSKL